MDAGSYCQSSSHLLGPISRQPDLLPLTNLPSSSRTSVTFTKRSISAIFDKTAILFPSHANEVHFLSVVAAHPLIIIHLLLPDILSLTCSVVYIHLCQDTLPPLPTPLSFKDTSACLIPDVRHKALWRRRMTRPTSTITKFLASVNFAMACHAHLLQ